MGVRVESYAGRRDDEPRRFFLRGRRVEIAEVEERWREPGLRCYRVSGNDGRRYLLRYYTAVRRWTLSGGEQRGGLAP